MRRQHQGRGPVEPVLQFEGAVAGIIHRERTDVLVLLGPVIVAGEHVLGVRIDDFRIARIGDDKTAFAAAGRIPVPLADHALVIGAGRGEVGVVLLRAIEPIGEAVIDGDMVELGRGLIVLGRPGVPAVDGDAGAAIIAVDHALWVRRINPKPMVIAVQSRDQFPALAAVGGLEHAGVQHIDRVRSFRVCIGLGEVPGPLLDPAVGADQLPALARVVRAVETAVFGLHHGVDAFVVRA